MYLIGSACKGHGVSWHIHNANTMQEPQVILIDTPVLSLSRNRRDHQTVTAAPLQLSNRGVKGQSVCSRAAAAGSEVSARPP